MIQELMDINSKTFGNGVSTLEETPYSCCTGGHLNIFLHEARDIYNICIYHEQDSYAKLFLTSDPEAGVSSKIITYAGRNPIFNECLCLDVSTLESCLRCEIWMRSRAQEYLKDQLLGLCLIPLSDIAVLAANGKLEKDFELSSTELFHSPAGFVKLSLHYNGLFLDVIALSRSRATIQDAPMSDAETEVPAMPCSYEKLEFPDLNVVAENQLMVSEFLLGSPPAFEGEHLSAAENSSSVGNSRSGTPKSCVSTSLSSSICFPEPIPRIIDKEDISSAAEEEEAVSSSVINMEMPQEETVIQKNIADMYSESVREFEKILANLKLPMDADGNFETSPEGSHSELKKLSSRSGSSRVFYGSRAFF